MASDRKRCLALLVVLCMGNWAHQQAAFGQTDPVLFELDSKPYRIQDLPEKLRGILAQQQARHFEETRDLYLQLAFDAHLERLAASSGRSRAELSRELLEPEAPTEAQARSFYEANKDRIPEEFETVKARIFKALRVERVAQKKRAIVAELESSKRLRIALRQPLPPPVDLPVDGLPTTGANDAPFTIVEFSDFSCPLCQRSARVLKKLLVEFPDRMRIVFAHYPVGKGGAATRIHEGGQCLAQQNLFWAYHDVVFERLASIQEDDAPSLAAELGADMEQFQACYSGSSSKWVVKRSLDLGRRLGVRRTPTLFVNGRPFASHQLEADLRRLLTQL